MTPKTKQEALRLIEALKAKIDELPDETRPVTEGWGVTNAVGAPRLHRTTINGAEYNARTILSITKDGVKVTTMNADYLDGIAHDDKGRIKVVGYVNAEELKERLVRPYMVDTSTIHTLIDELAG